MEQNHPNDLLVKYAILGRTFGVFVFLLGLSVYAGYFLNNIALKSLIPGIVAMNPATAFAFLCAGASLFLLTLDRRYAKVGQTLALITLLIGGAKVVSVLSGFDVYFDHLLFPTQLDDAATGYQNRMAPNTALNFFLVGLGLSFLHRRFNEHIGHGLILATFFIGLLTFIGYLFEVSYFIGVARYIPMALNTAIGFMMLTVGALFASGNCGLMQIVFSRDAGGFIARRLLPAAIAMPILFGLLFNNGRVSGIYTAELATSLLVLANSILFTILVWRLVAEVNVKDHAQKEAWGKLAEEKQLAQTLLSSIGDGVIAIDRDWRIFLWNKASEELSGYTASEAIGERFGDVVRFLREHDRKENTGFIYDAMHEGQIKFMENHTVMIRKDGSELPVGDSAAPILDENGKVQGVVIVYRDATQDREDKMLRSSYSYASHQLRTPVTQALWSLEVAKDEKDMDKCLDGVKMAYIAMKSVQKLVAALVEVSVIEQKTLSPKLEQVNLPSVVKEVEKEVAEALPERRISLKTEIPPAHEVLFTDQTLLRRILREVIENAIVYSKTDSEVIVAVRPDERGSLLEIKDQGIGIAEEQKSLVFTKFFRGSNLEADIPGAGLGLYLAKQYAHILQAKMWFESKEGEGSVFYILFEQKNSPK